MQADVWIPYAIRAGEALIFGIAAGLATYSQTGDWNAAVAAFMSALAGKATSSRLTFTNTYPK